MLKNGFILLEEKEMREVGGSARLWKHEKCGAEVLSISNKDENKCFGANFFTPPANSTGVAHILEHSVLCGSERFPVKEPFVELLKGSLQTFLNAFTFPDKTCYPVASANLKDFYNLIDVYLDAVFHPLLSKDTFKQEGWHIEAADMDGPWTFKGVVYNEMKGVYSSPESILAEQSQQAVFPDNLYSLDSGGKPEMIPSLTWLAFKDFHQRYYQPGNTRFFFWGDDPEDKRLELLLPYLEGAGPVGPLPQVNLQAPYSEPRYVDVLYAASKDDSRAFFTVNWLLGERGDVALALKMEMLEHILEGLPGSPLRRALIESGLGEDTVGGGLETDLRQMYYSTGLKGIAPGQVPQGEELIFNTLKKMVKDGISKQAIDAAVNSVEFAYRENNSGRFPRGLSAMIQALSTWLYGGDPLAPLAWEQPLQELRKAIDAGEKIFEEAIQSNFLDNKSRVRVTLLADPKLAELRQKRETVTLEEIQGSASPATREQIAVETENLLKAQLSPDKAEDLAKIPALGLEDLPRKSTTIPFDLKKIPETFITHDLPTNGILYASLLLPIKRVPARLVPLMSLFCRSFMDWGTAKEDYSQLGMKVASRLGSLSVNTILGNRCDNGEAFCYLSVSGKVVRNNMEDLFQLMGEILLEPQNNHDVILERLGQMIPEDRARLEASLQMGGHAAAALRVGAHFTGTEAWGEKAGGISQLRFLRELEKKLKNDPDTVISAFTELRDLTLSNSGAIFDCAGDADILAKAQNLAVPLLKSLPFTPKLDLGEPVSTWPPMTDLAREEVFLTQGQVNYVAKGANLYKLGYKYSGTVNVIMRWLRMGRLWEEVRVAGGAYGAFCSFSRFNGNYVCASYRDPNVDRTLSVYDGLAPYLRNFNPDKAQLVQAIVGAIGEVDSYLLPDAKAAKALMQWLCGLTEDMRQKSREEIFATSAADFHTFAEVLAAANEQSAICVIGGAKARQAAQEHGWQNEDLINNPITQ